MADLDEAVDHRRPLRQSGEPFAAIRVEGVERPQHGRARHDIEPLRLFDPRSHLVVVAANDRLRVQFAHAVDHGIGISAVSDDVAKHERAGVPPGPCIGQARVERFQIAVNIGQD